MEIIDWMDTHQGVVMGVLTFVYVVATILILKANYNSVKEMKKSREEENRPYIIVYFESKSNGPVNLIIKNIGKTLAKDTRIQIAPDLEYPDSYPLSKSNLLNKPISDIPPDYEYKAFVGMSWDLKDKHDVYPIYTANVSYSGVNTKKHYNEEYILDLNFQNGLLFLRERDIHDIAKDIHDYTKNSKRQLKSIDLSLNKIAIANNTENQVDNKKMY